MLKGGGAAWIARYSFVSRLCACFDAITKRNVIAYPTDIHEHLAADTSHVDGSRGSASDYVAIWWGFLLPAQVESCAIKYRFPPRFTSGPRQKRHKAASYELRVVRLLSFFYVVISIQNLIFIEHCKYCTFCVDYKKILIITRFNKSGIIFFVAWLLSDNERMGSYSLSSSLVIPCIIFLTLLLLPSLYSLPSPYSLPSRPVEKGHVEKVSQDQGLISLGKLFSRLRKSLKTMLYR